MFFNPSLIQIISLQVGPINFGQFPNQKQVNPIHLQPWSITIVIQPCPNYWGSQFYKSGFFSLLHHLFVKETGSSAFSFIQKIKVSFYIKKQKIFGCQLMLKFCLIGKIEFATIIPIDVISAYLLWRDPLIIESMQHTTIFIVQLLQFMSHLHKYVNIYELLIYI